MIVDMLEGGNMTALLCDRERHHGSRGAVFGAALAAVAVLTAPAISEAGARPPEPVKRSIVS